MSVTKIKEIAFHISTFRNIDLLNQGLYQIKVKVYTKQENRENKNSKENKTNEKDKQKEIKILAIPYYKTESKDHEDLLNSEDLISKPHNILTSFVKEDSNEFVCKTFLIRYSDEEVELDDYCYFRLETQSNVKQFYIDIELTFSEMIQNLNFKAKQKSNTLLSKIEFKQVQLITITINEDNNSFQESHIPVLFQDSYSSILNINFSMITVDYKLRKDSNVVFGVKEDNNSSNIDATSVSNSTINSSPHYLLDFFINEEQVTKINLIYNKSTHCLLPNYVDSLYDTYVISLMNSYSLLRIKYTKLAETFINNEQKYKELEYFTSLNQFIYYTDVSDSEFPKVNEMNFNYTENKALLRRFSKRLHSLNVEYVLLRVLLEISLVSSQLMQLWHKYLEFLRYFPNEYSFIMEQSMLKGFTEELSKFNKKHSTYISNEMNFVFQTDNNQLKINSDISEKLRNNIIKVFIKNSIEIPNLLINPATCPILLEESYTRKINDSYTTPTAKNSNNPELINDTLFTNNLELNENDVLNDSLNESTEIALHPNINALHLIILVHGFQGNSFDMRLLKYNLSLLNSTLVFLSSQANQDDTEADFLVMGEKLANEVKSFIKEWNDGVMFKRISFIGHSIGGLIIRAALPHLKDYSKKMFFYCSLSSPHLGYMYSSSSLIDAGMWVLKKIKKCKSLDQLSLSDVSNIYDSCLYKLSELEGFEWFEHIYLVSAHQDYYAPFESTRIQLCHRSSGSDYKGKFYQKMANNLLGKLLKNSLKRIDVNFVISERYVTI